MATKLVITDVTKPVEVDRPDGSTTAWFQVRVAAKRGLRQVIASRNFFVDAKDSIDREAAIAAMESGEDVGAGDDGLRLLSLDIDPRPVIIGGEQQLDKNGNPVFQHTANVIALPGETPQQALSGTFRGATIRGTMPTTDAPAVPADVPVDELADAAI